MAAQRIRTLYRSPLVTIDDYRCRSPYSGYGHEEYSSSHHVVFTRAGVFVKHSGPAARRVAIGDPTHVLFFNEGESYRVSHPAPGGDDCTVIAFARDTAAEVAASVDPSAYDRPDAPFRQPYAPVGYNTFTRFHRLRHALRRAADGDNAMGLAAEEEALAILRTTLPAGEDADAEARSRRRARTARAHRELATSVREHLAAHPGHAHPLPELARLHATSPYHLTRVFRMETGMPIHQYLLRLRIHTALSRLAEGETDLSRLACSLGFNSHSHFTSVFRRLTGKSPSAARAALRGEGTGRRGAGVRRMAANE